MADHAGTAEFMAPPNRLSMQGKIVSGPPRAGWDVVSVPTVTVDDVRAERNLRVDLVKMDVEGHEPAALAGMAQTIREDRPALLIEILNPDRGEEIRGLLDGYTAQAVTSKGLLSMDRLERSDKNEKNFLFTPA